MIVLVLGVLLVLAAALPIGLHLLVWKPATQPVRYRVFCGLVVSKSANGSQWILTFTTAPAGMNASTTYLSLTTGAGVAALQPRTLSSLPGSSVALLNSLGALDLACSHSFPLDQVLGGDSVVIGTSTTAGTPIAGFTAQIYWNGTRFYADGDYVLT